MRLDKLGWLYVEKGQPQEALTYCDQAVAASNGKAKYQATRARALSSARAVRRGVAADAGAVPEEQDGHI